MPNQADAEPLFPELGRPAIGSGLFFAREKWLSVKFGEKSSSIGYLENLHLLL
jgi:hypothetical protein